MRTYWMLGAIVLALAIASGPAFWQDATATPLTPAVDEAAINGPPASIASRIRLHQALHRESVRNLRPVSSGFGTSPWGRPPAIDPFGRPGSQEPVPIPGGLFDGAFHLFLPGPTDLGFGGVDVEPNVITDFQGFVAIAYMVGQAMGSDGNTYDMSNDMRVIQGNYIADDGTRQRGTFVFT